MSALKRLESIEQHILQWAGNYDRASEDFILELARLPVNIIDRMKPASLERLIRIFLSGEATKEFMVRFHGQLIPLRYTSMLLSKLILLIVCHTLAKAHWDYSQCVDCIVMTLGCPRSCWIPLTVSKGEPIPIIRWDAETKSLHGQPCDGYGIFTLAREFPCSATLLHNQRIIVFIGELFNEDLALEILSFVDPRINYVYDSPTLTRAQYEQEKTAFEEALLSTSKWESISKELVSRFLIIE
jgi:hypothetical protein